MASIKEWATVWQSGLATSLIDIDSAIKFIIEAANEYQAWGFIKASQNELFTSINSETDLTVSEWGVIKPLAYLLAEYETALMQEASRVASHEPYGRSSSEIAQDIANFRNEYMRKWAFYSAPETI